MEDLIMGWIKWLLGVKWVREGDWDIKGDYGNIYKLMKGLRVKIFDKCDFRSGIFWNF